MIHEWVGNTFRLPADYECWEYIQTPSGLRYILACIAYVLSGYEWLAEPLSGFSRDTHCASGGCVGAYQGSLRLPYSWRALLSALLF